MLTIKQITEDTDKVIRGLEKKHFANAKEAIAKVLECNDRRRNAQNQLDRNLAEVNSLSKSIDGFAIGAASGKKNPFSIFVA